MRRSISVPPRYANVLYLEKLRVGSKSVATLAGVGRVAKRKNRKATSEKFFALCDICRLYHVLRGGTNEQPVHAESTHLL